MLHIVTITYNNIIKSVQKPDVFDMSGNINIINEIQTYSPLFHYQNVGIWTEIKSAKELQESDDKCKCMKQ